ncbi:ABC transporter substrate-binding protein [Pollutimonas nitritireducens]|nr:ABC transporter substrate-binding protein [Pollutimonas nitritireducens]
MTTSYVNAATVNVGTSRDPNNGAQVLIAEQKGFFEAAGLDVSVKYFPSGGDLMSAFVGGSIDYGSSGAIPILTVRARPFPLKVIAQMSDISGAQHLIVKEGTKSLDELKGKKIGVMLGTASEAFYKVIIEKYELDADSLTVVNMDPTDMTTAFIRGDVEAIVLWEPVATNARKLGKGKTLISATNDYRGATPEAKRIYGDHSLLFANEKTIESQPEVASAMIEALKKASEFIQNNRDEAVAIMAKTYVLQPHEMNAILDMNKYSLEISDQLISDLEVLTDFLVTSKRIKKETDPRQMIDTSVLKKVDAALVTCSGC